MDDFLLNNLIGFFHVLRAAGIRVSLSETIDAIRALAYTELMDRAAVKAALSSCTAKSEVEKMIFDKCFERFFIDPSVKNDYISAQAQAHEVKRLEIIERAAELRYQGQELAISADLKEVYSEVSEEERRSILEYLERSSAWKNMKPEFKPLMENVVKSKLLDLKNKRDESGNNTGAFESPDSEAGIIAGDVAAAIR